MLMITAQGGNTRHSHHHLAPEVSSHLTHKHTHKYRGLSSFIITSNQSDTWRRCHSRTASIDHKV